MNLVLGCIADDFTGATDLANTLVRQGMRTVQLIGCPSGDAEVPEDAEAVVVALKSRTIDPEEAVRQSLEALRWLRRHGARQYFFKYCSTFDSTDRGNIGPVAAALVEALGGEFTVACPAFPANGRTVYRGYLFVGDVLLSESGMQHHPLTPMTDANLVRVLGRQTDGGVGLVPYHVVRQGADAIGDAMARIRDAGLRFAIVDALTDEHLVAIGRACRDLLLITGGSGVAMGLPANYRAQGLVPQRDDAASLPASGGYGAILAGSCSGATLAQIEHFEQGGLASLKLDPLRLAAGEDAVAAAVEWAVSRLGNEPVLIYSSAAPEALAGVQAELGRDRSGGLVEQAMAAIARGLVAAGVRRLLVAGGETSGSVVSALGVTALQIGPEISPGVPWTLSVGEPALFLALKSGNFGGPAFFLEAFEALS